jgi:hypothetical protein
MKARVTARPLQPAEENFGGAGIRDSSSSQTVLDLLVRRRFAVTTRCAAPVHAESGTPNVAGVPPSGAGGLPSAYHHARTPHEQRRCAATPCLRSWRSMGRDERVISSSRSPRRSLRAQPGPRAQSRPSTRAAPSPRTNAPARARTLSRGRCHRCARRYAAVAATAEESRRREDPKRLVRAVPVRSPSQTEAHALCALHERPVARFGSAQQAGEQSGSDGGSTHHRHRIEIRS